MTKQEIQERDIKCLTDIKGNEITECYLELYFVVELLCNEEHPCIRCNIHHCKHNYNK